MKNKIVKEAGAIVIMVTMVISSCVIATNVSDVLDYEEWVEKQIEEQLGGGPSFSSKTKGVGMFTSIALDGNNAPHISYSDYGNGDLKYASWDDSTWQIETVDSIGDVGYSTSIKIDVDDYPHISYLDYGNFDLKYAYWTGSTWSIETVDSIGEVGYQTSIALDSNGNPHISYVDVTNLDLKYAFWTGSTWDIELVDPGFILHPTSIALDSEDRPHISYTDFGSNDLKYASFTGTSWITETVDGTGNVGVHTSLAFDSNNIPHISYHDFDHGYLKHAYYMGGSWKTETVDWLDDYRPTGKYTSIDIDSMDQPHISYLDQDHCDLKYAYKQGDTWVTECIESEGSVGYYSSLKLDNNDLPHISYMDIGYLKLKYASLNQKSWNVQTIDACPCVDHPGQENIQMCGSGLISAGTTSAIAQSFIPRLETLSRVEIPLFKIGRPTGLTISIRSDLDGENIASDYLSGENIAEGPIWWSIFDFEEVAVTPGETYYIVWETEDDTTTNCFCWNFGYNDPYQQGESWRFQGHWSNAELSGFEDIDLCFKTFGPNTPPSMPEITGPQEGETGESHDYIISAADDENDELVYCIDWGEGEELSYGPYPSGEEQTISHTWIQNGDYTISIKSQDPYDGQSDYANLQVKMPKDKLFTNPFMKFLENFPMIYKLLISILE